MSTDDPLQTPIQFLTGVGPERAKLLEKLGIRTVEDVLYCLPRGIIDLTDIRDVANLEADRLQTVRGVVVDLDSRKLSKGRSLVAILLDCDGQYLRGVWFNQPWMLRRFSANQPVLFSGKPKRRGGRWEINSPRVQWIEDDEAQATAGVLPKYRLTEGLRMFEMRRIVRAAIEEYAESLVDPLPAKFRQIHNLYELRQAVHDVHLPTSVENYHAARRRFLFEDLLEFQLAVSLRRREWREIAGAPVVQVTSKIDSRIRRLFPFRLTEGQDHAVAEIARDLQSGRTMHRLLHAEVGAGKTAVALYAMLAVVAAGHQTVLMAPTELLANQHWGTVDGALLNSRVKRALLTGQLSMSERREALNSIRSGESQLIVGTHAVIQDDVEFDQLGLVVIDEQHRFGVEQRSHFSMGNDAPHMLVMTATPIPRTICLTAFGDLDVTTIADLPPGRQKVITGWADDAAKRNRAWNFVRQKLDEGRQVYVVCPRIGDDDTANSSELESVNDTFESLSNSELKGYRLGLIHGRMDSRERSKTMSTFRDGTIQALVATTVIEVGVDVPNATLMVVLNADRFGLSQLHQLRGRIARGKFQGYCFLFSENAEGDGAKRLAAMEEYSDGFQIAEIDFQLRGPGDILGTRQHGELPLRHADLIEDQAMVAGIHTIAQQLVESGDFDQQQFGRVKEKVFDRFSQMMNLPNTG